ncbi:MAG: hypothetical protein ACI867_000890, partial [Glaciecola sp.]
AILVVDFTATIPAATRSRAGSCGSSTVGLYVLGATNTITASMANALNAADGRPC